MLASNRYIKNFKITKNELSLSDIKEMAGHFQKQTALRVNLGTNDITDEGALVLAKVLENYPFCFDLLNLVTNHIMDLGFKSLIQAVLNVKKTSLTYLNIQNNQFSLKEKEFKFLETLTKFFVQCPSVKLDIFPNEIECNELCNILGPAIEKSNNYSFMQIY